MCSRIMAHGGARRPVNFEAIFQHYFDGAGVVVSGFDSRFSFEDAREAAENGYVEQEDADKPVFVPRWGHRRLGGADAAVRAARELVTERGLYGAEATLDWLMPGLEEEYGLEGDGFALRTTWTAFGFL